MIHTDQYQTKDLNPLPSTNSSRPQSRLRKPRPSKLSEVTINSGDLDYLCDFVKVMAFYIEDLEDFLGEEMTDFWQSRDTALHIITDAMLQRLPSEY